MTMERKHEGFSSFGPSRSGETEKISSSTLHEEAKEMERRLEQLKVQMLQEQERRDSVPMHGGSRWRSAREDRGSVRLYSKDVKEKQKKRPKKPKLESAQSWDCKRVASWLEENSLARYKKTFADNSINGTILLAISDEDLDYLKVWDLEDRKTIFKLVARLNRRERCQNNDKEPKPNTKRERRKTKESSEPLEKKNGISTRQNNEPNLSSGSTSREPLRNSFGFQEKETVHWSQIPPLCERQVKNAASNDTMVNLGDGQYNETESHMSFLEALNDWRNSNTPNAEPEPGDDLWVNPFNSGDTEEQTNSDPQTPREDMRTFSGSDSLLEGEYDEEKERLAFQEAVQEWRKGKALDAHSQSERKNSESVCRDTGEEATTQTGNLGTTSNQSVPDIVSCWSCYKLFDKSSVTSVNKHFCSETCKKEDEDYLIGLKNKDGC